MKIEAPQLERGGSGTHIFKLIQRKLWVRIIIGMICGAVLGALLSPQVDQTSLNELKQYSAVGDWLRLPGSLFLNSLQMVIMPLIGSSIMLGITSAGNTAYLAKVASRILPYFLSTTFAAVLLGVVTYNLVKPHEAFDLQSPKLQTELAGQASEKTLDSVPEKIAQLIPSNPTKALFTQNMLQIVVMAFFSGVAVLSVGVRKCQPLLEVISLIQEVSLKVVAWAMLIAPIAVFGLMADFVMRVGLDSLVALSAYIATVMFGLIMLLVMYVLIAVAGGRKKPGAFISKVFPVQLLAFSTSSSAAVMPLSMKVARDELNVPRPLAGFIIPLGATVNMDGTALYQVIAALFITQTFGVVLSDMELALLIVSVVGASVGSPSTPGVGIVILATILAGIGVPATGVAILLGVDRLLDMCRTALNVTGDLTAAVVMARLLPEPEPEPEPEFEEADTVETASITQEGYCCSNLSHPNRPEPKT